MEITDSSVCVDMATLYRKDKEIGAASIYLTDVTDRDLRLRKLDYAEEFTRVYKDNLNKGKAIREAACLGVMLREALQPLQEKDLLAGRIVAPEIGVSPEPGGIGYYYNYEFFNGLCEEFVYEPHVVQRIEALTQYWQGRTTQEHIRESFDKFTAQTLPSDEYETVGGISSFPLYRIAGCQLDYRKLLTQGIPGLRLEVEAIPAGDFREGLLGILTLFCEICKEYSAHARSCAKHELADVLTSICVQAPQTFHEALQLSWLYSAVSGVINYGRMDDYLGEFLVRDLDGGKLSTDRARALLCSQWEIIAWRNTIWNGRVMLGGKGRQNEEAADRFALLAMEVQQQVRPSEPQLSLRFYKGQNSELYNKALELIGAGLTFPILYNDDVNIPSLSKAMNIPLELAEHYLPFGCGEFILNHRSVGTPNGLINLAQLLIAVLQQGKEYQDFEELYADFSQTCAREITALARAQRCSYTVTAKETSLLFLSMLYDNCLGRNLALLDGGLFHFGGTMESYGNTNTADSLMAIKHLVYDKKTCTLDELRKALIADFEGHANILQQVKNAPKYGNDEDEPDRMAKRLHDTVCSATIDAGRKIDFASYLVVMINNSANSTLGNLTGATPDGRRAYRPLANANNPQAGADVNGVSALLNSLNIITNDNHAGVVQNLRLQKFWWQPQNRPALEALLSGYFKSGGTQLMITVTSREELEAALRTPELYSSLLVRVGGFSARFIDLPPNIQEDILSRTDH